MTEKTLRRYLQIINTYNEIEKSFGVLAPHISRDHKVALVIYRVPFPCSRTTVWRALGCEAEVKRQERFL